MNGFEYVVEAIDYCLNNPGAEHNLCNEVYPHVADKFLSDFKGTPWKRIERCIRLFIETIFQYGDMYEITKNFGSICSASTGKTTNAQFICTLLIRVRHLMEESND